VDYIEFEDNFNPGDQIIIDSGKFKITRNGQNVSHLYTGDFLQLNPGTNSLRWTDPETARTVLFRITHRDRFLY
ncbi:phage distal tail protein, partial [Paenibacillus xylanilyticus]